MTKIQKLMILGMVTSVAGDKSKEDIAFFVGDRTTIVSVSELPSYRELETCLEEMT